METRRMCPHCRAFITTKDRTCPYCNEAVAPPAARRSSGPVLGGFIPHARFNTVIILVINFGLYLATSIYSMKSGRGNAMGLDSYTLIDFGAMYSPAIAAGQWWRLVTAGFLHGGLLHIMMNSFGLFDLGALVDEMYGTSRMLVIYFVSSVAGFYASSLWKVGPSIGASAALFGLIGAMIALGTRSRSSAAGSIRSFFVRWLVWGLLFSLMPGIDMMAHIGGLAGGFAVGYIAGEPRREGSPGEMLWRVLSWVCILLTVVSFLKMYLWLTHTPQ
ncbi:MAG TPA: rhomboid family intramembrane serine protease [Bryobacteraceae bacterium]|nr:rhomboid family intramembrane serine protease [Bryobacteraceae bacterium]